MKKWIELDFEVGQIVYLITDSSQQKRIVTGILMRPNGVTYELTCGTLTSWNYSFEISVSQDIVVKTSSLD